MRKWEKQYVSNVQSELQGCDVLEPNDVIAGIFEEVSHIDTIADLEAVDVSNLDVDIIKVNSFDMYEVLSQFCEELEESLEAHVEQEVRVETKYKTVAKKVRPIAGNRIKLFKQRDGHVLYDDFDRQHSHEDTGFDMEQDYADANEDGDANVLSWHLPEEVQVWRG